MTDVHSWLEYPWLGTRVVLGKVAMFTNLAVIDDRRDHPSHVQHIADILPLVLERYETHETHSMPRVERRPSHIMPSYCVSA